MYRSVRRMALPRVQSTYDEGRHTMNDEQTNFDDLEFTDSTSGRVDEFWKPTATGAEITGKYIGSFESKHGMCYMLEARGHVFGLPSNDVIVKNFEHKPVGTIVRITFEGEVMGKNGRTYKNYRIQDGKPKTEFKTVA